MQLITLDSVSERHRNCSKRYIGHNMAQCMADGHGDQQLEKIHINWLQKNTQITTVTHCPNKNKSSAM